MDQRGSGVSGSTATSRTASYDLAAFPEKSGVPTSSLPPDHHLHSCQCRLSIALFPQVLATVRPSLNLGQTNAAGISYEKFIRTSDFSIRSVGNGPDFGHTQREFSRVRWAFGHAGSVVGYLPHCRGSSATIPPQYRFPWLGGSRGQVVTGASRCPSSSMLNRLSMIATRSGLGFRLKKAGPLRVPSSYEEPGNALNLHPVDAVLSEADLGDGEWRDLLTTIRGRQWNTPVFRGHTRSVDRSGGSIGSRWSELVFSKDSDPAEWLFPLECAIERAASRSTRAQRRKLADRTDFGFTVDNDKDASRTCHNARCVL